MVVKFIRNGSSKLSNERMTIGGRAQATRGVAISKAPERRFPIPDLQPHPQTGAVYLIVLDTIPSFMEIRAAYARLALPWLAVISQVEYPSAFEKYRSSRAVFLSWMFEKGLAPCPPDRRATLVAMYDEAMDDDLSRLLPWHQGWWRNFVARTKPLDAVMGCTPWMAQTVGAKLGKPSAVLPVGWDPSVLGEPNWNAVKRHQAAFYGSVAGRRDALLPALRRGFGAGLEVISNAYGADLIRRIDACKTVLYVGHSAVRSYSTRRLWHAVASSAALVTEPGDYWPLEHAHCIEIPLLEPTDLSPLLDAVAGIGEAEAIALAKSAHEQLQSWTVRHCVETYLVEGTAPWLKA